MYLTKKVLEPELQKLKFENTIAYFDKMRLASFKDAQIKIAYIVRKFIKKL